MGKCVEDGEGLMNKRWIQKGWPPVLVVIILLLVWHFTVKLFNIRAWLLPDPISVLKEAIESYDRLWMHTTSTIQITVIGFMIGISIGLLIAVLLHAVIPKFKPGFYPLLVMSQNIPIIALAPLLQMWFGFGMFPKILIIILVCFFPVTLAALEGFTQTDRNMMNYMRMTGAKRKDVFLKLELPYSLPFIFAGLKISATYSVMGAVISEWVGAKQGLGLFMMLAKSSYRVDRVFVAIMVIVVLSLTMFILIQLLEKWLIRWNPKHREGDQG